MIESKADKFKAGYQHGDLDRKRCVPIPSDVSLRDPSYRQGYWDGLAGREFKPWAQPGGARTSPDSQQEGRLRSGPGKELVSDCGGPALAPRWQEQRSGGWWHGGE